METTGQATSQTRTPTINHRNTDLQWLHRHWASELVNSMSYCSVFEWKIYGESLATPSTSQTRLKNNGNKGHNRQQGGTIPTIVNPTDWSILPLKIGRTGCWFLCSDSQSDRCVFATSLTSWWRTKCNHSSKKDMDKATISSHWMEATLSMILEAFMFLVSHVDPKQPIVTSSTSQRQATSNKKKEH